MLRCRPLITVHLSARPAQPGMPPRPGRGAEPRASATGRSLDAATTLGPRYRNPVGPARPPADGDAGRACRASGPDRPRRRTRPLACVGALSAGRSSSAAPVRRLELCREASAGCGHGRVAGDAPARGDYVDPVLKGQDGDPPAQFVAAAVVRHALVPEAARDLLTGCGRAASAALA